MAWNDKEFVPASLGDKFDEADPFHKLVLDLALEVETPADLLDALVAAVSLPDIPPDVTEVRIMSLHKGKGLSSPVVIIAGCVEGLLPTAPDEDLPPANRDAKLEEERRLFFVGLTRVKAEPGHLAYKLLHPAGRCPSRTQSSRAFPRPAWCMGRYICTRAGSFKSLALQPQLPCEAEPAFTLANVRSVRFRPFLAMRTRTLWMRARRIASPSQ
jgi:hypothetical protein